jgi:hypothetical protein
MTPKEQAEILFNKMDMIIYTDQDNWKHQCIRCAIVSVELAQQNSHNDTYEYWEQVKYELNKM